MELSVFVSRINIAHYVYLSTGMCLCPADPALDISLECWLHINGVRLRYQSVLGPTAGLAPLAGGLAHRCSFLVNWNQYNDIGVLLPYQKPQESARGCRNSIIPRKERSSGYNSLKVTFLVPGC